MKIVHLKNVIEVHFYLEITMGISELAVLNNA
jgi:hypothetical protein